MVDLSNYPYPKYEPNKVAASVLAVLVGISLIAWFAQSVQSHFRPRRLMLLILVSHVSIFIVLVLRAAISTAERNSRITFTVTTILLAIGLRVIILSNYSFLTEVRGTNNCLSRLITIGAFLATITSVILTIPVGILSFNNDTINLSFLLRQISAGIVLCLTVLFYPIWFVTKTAKDMMKKAIVLLIISSFSCMIVAIFILVTSLPDYYIGSNEQELWFYIFQLTPIIIAQLTWTILHPKRSLIFIDDRQQEQI